METEQLSTVNILNLFETSKRERQSFVDDLINRIEDGQVEALRVHLQAKCMESILKDLFASDTYRDYLLSEAEKNGKKFSYHNSEFSIKEVGTAYDFSKCEDTELVALMEQQDMIKKLVDVRKDFLKTVPQTGLVVTNEDTGETFKVYPPAKTSTTSVAVSLK